MSRPSRKPAKKSAKRPMAPARGTQTRELRAALRQALDEKADNQPDDLGVTPKQYRFVHEYLLDLNATQAAVRAGYSAKTAGSQAHDLLKKPEIAALVAYKQREQVERTRISAEKLKQTLWNAAHPNLARLHDSRGRLRPLHLLSEADLANIVGVEVVKRNVYSNDGEVDDVIKIKHANPDAAREILAKHFGLAKDVVEHTGGVALRWLGDEDDDD